MTRPTNIGSLDQRLVLETQEPAALTADGGREDAPIVRVELWAHVRFDRFSPSDEDARRATRETIVVTVRWRCDVGRDTAVVWRGNRYSVLSLEYPDTACDWLILRCARDA